MEVRGLIIILLAATTLALGRGVKKVSKREGLDFQLHHRVKPLSHFLHEQTLDLEVMKADPFVSDFVPVEFNEHLPDLGKKRRRRVPRDVDSNEHMNMVFESVDEKERFDPDMKGETENEATTSVSDLGNSTSTLESIKTVREHTSSDTTTSTPSSSMPDSSSLEYNDSTTIASTPTSTTPASVIRNQTTLELLQKQIDFLLTKNITTEERQLLLDINQRLNVSDATQLLELTMELLVMMNNVQKGEASTTSDSSSLPTTTTDPEPSEEFIEGLTREGTQACKYLEHLKIRPDDDKVTVQAKQGTMMQCFMDQTTDPCQDFYQYACGGWTDYHPIPKDKSDFSIFEILRVDLQSNLIDMFEETIHEDDSNATAAVKLLYKSCMDTDTIEERKEAPLLHLLDSFGGWPVLKGSNWDNDSFDWIDTISQLRLFNNDILISIWVGPDGKDSADYILQFDHSDLLLPSMDYYELDFNHPVIQSYYRMLVDVSNILGAKPEVAKREMKELIEFETQIASIMESQASRRNYSEIYKKMTLAELQIKVPDFNFSQYLEPVLPRTLNDTEMVVIYALPYFQKLTKLIAETDKRTVANYVLWRFVRNRINNLDQRFEIAQQGLTKILYGREESPARQVMCVDYVNGNLGNVVGSLYVQRHFDSQSKRDMESLTNQVQASFRDIVLRSEWLSNSTKELAQNKIDNIVHSIGYPDAIVDEDEIEYHEDEFFENVLKNLRARTAREMAQLDTTVNRTLWTITPAVVNAYYSRNRNQIMFPAAILQPPFYHKHFPRALNYGGIGAVIGHEITHGFDDKGQQFDAQGNIRQWWDHQSFQKFQNRKECMIDQYSQYKVKEVGINLNGQNTQGENIADNGGIKQAYTAYRSWMEVNNIVEEEKMPGLEHMTEDQLFFLNFAQIWCGSTRPEALRSKLKSSVHAPGPYRVLGTLSNSKEFAKAFQCPAGSKMNPEAKCSVW